MASSHNSEFSSRCKLKPLSDAQQFFVQTSFRESENLICILPFLFSLKGRFEILSLSGSFTPTELGGSRIGRTGGMSISLASPDGRVVGGTLAGLLVAASPVQVPVFLFFQNIKFLRFSRLCLFLDRFLFFFGLLLIIYSVQ